MYIELMETKEYYHSSPMNVLFKYLRLYTSKMEDNSAKKERKKKKA